MTVAGNVKQVMTIILSILFFNLVVNFTNSVGIILTLLGGAWYAKVEFDRKQESQSSVKLSADNEEKALSDRKV